ncbi:MULTISPECIES: 6-hydroxymethylpterin diphosphokinase MptE-like protein [unclassified Archaeoglobus]|jgi:hypothetical protein|uniref:6-hydroxymethylpterin diphosphokinase MptE-like protein n=1 Tax=unclassified Archaeoglobus TaxID=2643606 RepID=UPI0025BDDA56|nr:MULTISPECIES: 6-hydroxymethylpterin diphosphokinase MptE-like protein [unclassified Archaeoglobus]
MNVMQWFKIYEEILADFGFSREEDEKAAKIMKELGGGKLMDESALEVLKGKDVAVIGGAYEGEEIREDVKITAGKAIYRVDFTPNIHVTDLEEDEGILVELESKGCILVLHAHGDNIEQIRSVVPKLKKFVGTTQSVPFDRIYNFGGFTDGDRAALIAKKFGARKIRLYGFNFEKADNKIKLKKLKWAKRILEKEGII